jgi:hypothetical protein
MSITAREEKQTSWERQRGHLPQPIMYCPAVPTPWNRRLKKCIPSRIGRRRCGHSATVLYSTNWHIPHCPCNAPGVQERLQNFFVPRPNHTAFRAEYRPPSEFSRLRGCVGPVGLSFRRSIAGFAAVFLGEAQMVAITMNTTHIISS